MIRARLPLRNLMAEIGCFQEEPTLMYQDCSPAVSVANDRGSLAKKSKAMDIRVFAIRNKIEDHQIMLKLISTVEMVADMGTKALDQKKFVFFRDVMNGAICTRTCIYYDGDALAARDGDH